MAEENTLLTNEETTTEETEVTKTEETTGTLEKSDESSTDATSDEKPEDDKGKTPVEYSDFTFPEGYEADPEVMEKFTPLAQKYGIPQEDAQALIDLYVKSQQDHIDAFVATVDEWRKTAEADKEYGGKALKENLGHAHRLIEKFGTPELKEYLNAYGAGNHPEVLRFFVRVGKAMAEDTIETGGNPKGEARDIAKIFFPNMN